MSYEVFAQKWRPQFFRDVVGQEHVTATLQNQIRSERLGHAYLFWGPRGTGKTTVARLFAKAVNCLNATEETDLGPVKSGEPCNKCDACETITQGSSFDVIEMDAASNRGIDTIRDLRENVKLSPAAFRYKIYIIDEVHMLTPEGFNALLKTLEEPPNHVIFIMATTEHSQIPKTIVSRCQDFDFRHLTPEQIISRLQLIADDEEITLEDEVLPLITRQSEGCLRDAENLLERLVTSSGNQLTLENVEETLGLGSSSLIHRLTEAITERDLTEGLATLNQLSKQGMDLTKCLQQFIAYFRDLRILAIDTQLDDHIQSPKSEVPALKAKAEKVSVERLTRIIKILMHANREIKEYGFAQLQLESALIQIHSIHEAIQLDELVNKLIAIEQKIGRSNEVSQGTSPETIPNTPIIPPIEVSPSSEVANNLPAPQNLESTVESTIPPTQEPQEPDTSEYKIRDDQTQIELNSENITEIWDKVKLHLPRYLTIGVFENVAVPKDDENRIIITCARGSFSLVDEDAKQTVSKLFFEFVGKKVQIDFTIAEDNTKQESLDETPDAEEVTTPLMRRRQAEEDKEIRSVLDEFDARILETNI